MESEHCEVIYLDERAQCERTVEGEQPIAFKSPFGPAPSADEKAADVPPFGGDIDAGVQAMLTSFPRVHVCKSSASCLSKISSCNEFGGRCSVLVLVDIPNDELVERRPFSAHDARSPSPSSGGRPATDTHEHGKLYGLSFIRHIKAEVHMNNISNVVMPVAVLRQQLKEGFQVGSAPLFGNRDPSNPTPAEQRDQTTQLLDSGAIDVLSTPMSPDRAHALFTHAYRIQRDFYTNTYQFSRARRKSSWMGAGEVKPFSYLREAMVSRLMDGICNPNQSDQPVDISEIDIKPERYNVIAQAIGTWGFSAHDFTDDELLYAAYLMLEHALKLPSLEKWRLSKDQLLTFLLSTRRIYNAFVNYHNFRHACDVLQATFFFLISIGTIPACSESVDAAGPRSVAEDLLGPIHALTLLISAIGHDVGHPGVNNLFLVAINAPLAQLYNDRSVLESFHCAAYSQLLRRHWPAAFSDLAMRKLMINAILATDMGLHFQYMGQMRDLKDKIAANNDCVTGWTDKTLDEHRELLCCLLLKCADICNVARKFDVATNWAYILMDEVINQGVIEKELEIPTCLMGGPPVKEDVIKMGGSQIGFMKLFAIPLFSGIMEVLPKMSFGIDSINNNRLVWEDKVAAETQRRSTVMESSQAKPVQDTMDNIQKKTEEFAHDLENGRSESSTLANIQPKSRASISGPPSQKSSSGAAHLAHLSQMAEHERRSSLGPTVLPLAVAETSSRKSSGGYQSGLTQPQSPEGAFDLTHSQLQQLDESKTLSAGRYQAASPPAPASNTPNEPHANTLSSDHPELDTEVSAPSTLVSESASKAETAVESPEPMEVYSPGMQSSKQDNALVAVSSVRRKQSRFSLKFWRKKSRTADLSP